MISKLLQMIYACPNCNIDLMIVINNLDNNCTFKISLAPVNHMKQSMEEKDMQVPKDTINFDDTCMLKSNIIENEVKSSDIVINENINDVCETSLALQEDDNCLDVHVTLPNKKVLRQTNEDTRKYMENTLEDNDPSKLQELETEVNTTTIKSNASLLNSDHDGSGNLIKIESVSNSVDNLIDIETVNDSHGLEILSTNDVIECTFDEEVDIKEDDSTMYVTETERECVEEDLSKCSTNDCAKRWMECDLCRIRYLSREKYEFHMERHKLNKMDKFACTICDKEAGNEKSLWDHYFYMHKSSVRHVCAICDKRFTRKGALESHQKKCKRSGSEELNCTPVETSVSRTIELKETPVNCSLCGNPVTDINPKAINDLVTCAACEDSAFSLMVNGIDMKTIPPPQYHCSHCPKHFVHKERFEFHEMRHNKNMKDFICSTCGKEFRTENSLYGHYLFVHKGPRPYICELCDKSFRLKTQLKEHFRTHTKKPYQCDLCGQRSNTISSFKRHRRTHFSHSRYTCKICDKSFSKKQNMNEHLEKHRKDNKNVPLPQIFTCPLCTEILPTYHMLKAHKEKVHESKVNLTYECDICKSTYNVKQMLIKHIRNKHNGEKRFKCAQCHKGFNYIDSLYSHVLLHRRKQFFYEYCNKNFRRKESRNLHHRKHMDVKQPSEHSDSGQTVSTSNVRAKRHQEPSKGETKCSECGEICNSQQEIRMHLNKHLGEKLNKLQDV